MNNYQYRSPLEGDYDNPEAPAGEYSYSPYYENYYGGQKSSSYRGSPHYEPYSRPNRASASNSQMGSRPYSSYATYSSVEPSSYASRGQSGPSFRDSSYLTPGEPSPSLSREPRYLDQFKGPSYPEELTCLFGAMECRLCGIEVTAPIVAKMHYCGKQHLKKVKSFMEEWCLRTGNPMPAIKNPLATSSSPSASNIPEFCDLCDVKMVTLNDKLLHMAGKQHRKNAADPSKAKKKKREIQYIELDERFGIGGGFLPPESEGAKAPEKEAVVEEFVCELCDVRAVSQDQLNAHLNGKKHKDKVEKKNSTVPKPGQYYCGVCNLTLNAELQFIEHVENKRHKRNFMSRKSKK